MNYRTEKASCSVISNDKILNKIKIGSRHCRYQHQASCNKFIWLTILLSSKNKYLFIPMKNTINFRSKKIIGFVFNITAVVSTSCSDRLFAKINVNQFTSCDSKKQLFFLFKMILNKITSDFTFILLKNLANIEILI